MFKIHSKPSVIFDNCGQQLDRSLSNLTTPSEMWSKILIQSLFSTKLYFKNSVEAKVYFAGCKKS